MDLKEKKIAAVVSFVPNIITMNNPKFDINTSSQLRKQEESKPIPLTGPKKHPEFWDPTRPSIPSMGTLQRSLYPVHDVMTKVGYLKRKKKKKKETMKPNSTNILPENLSKN